MGKKGLSLHLLFGAKKLYLSMCKCCDYKRHTCVQHSRTGECVCEKYSTLKCLQFAHKMSHVDSARRCSGCGDVGVVFHTSRL